ncbi:DUF1697 domain-containing protein [Papillibacter cinnamivorans]|uniref:Uncharacterized conserved protein, DUF1697 family n=1 Tax=Papillibacter cinnamivorans DSM 12816 TaxID=1122930 RepID=A0A1W1ZMR3_9FIRM|nr:DUF1697 domain-containing protein [Papillibacter cinnamivorans]SMC49398.1 Uncharacterized conserved protein, DUF1697 family [Papillibacter cinnamivorans DSM 12816]
MKYAAFFRGINVGGKNKVKMADLKQLFQDCGFGRVQTYIQSGNVLFESDEAEHLLPDLISHAFTERFGFKSPVVLRSGDEISEILSAEPFAKEDIEQAEAKNPEVEHLYVFLSDGNIDPAAAETLRLAYGGEDMLFVRKRELHLLCSHGVRDSKLAASLSKPGAPMTFRNRKTLLKIHELLGADDIR